MATELEFVRVPDLVRIDRDVCDRCEEPLEGDWKSCPFCGFVYAPDAQKTQEELEEDVKKDYRDTDPEDTDDTELLDRFDDALDDPEFKEELLKKLTE